ncbi:beta-glycosidase, partial [bacterium]|nr:beta-glycosidase [bacterium]
TGNTSLCAGSNGVTYTVPSIPNAISYVWTLPTGASGTSTTNSITVNYSNTALSGNITVKGSNSYGDGLTSSLAITVKQLLGSIGNISGTSTLCAGTTGVIYTVPAVDNATSYTWTLPTGASGTSSTNSITVGYNNTALSGNITVKAVNDCGETAVKSLAITVKPL